jgi:DNA-binding XRE family transcriptional regulator
MTIGEKILIRRKELGLSQEQLADQLKVSRQSISKWEQDGAIPDFINGIALCRLLDITPEELIRNEPLASSTKKQLVPSLFISKEVFIVKIVLVAILFALFGKLNQDLVAYSAIHYTFNLQLLYLYTVAPYFLSGIILFYKAVTLPKQIEMWVFELIFLAIVGLQGFLMFTPYFYILTFPWAYKMLRPLGLLSGVMLVLFFNSIRINKQQRELFAILSNKIQRIIHITSKRNPI